MDLFGCRFELKTEWQMIFHPRRNYRRLRIWFKNLPFIRSCQRKGIGVKIGKNSVLNHCHVKGTFGGEIIIEDYCTINNCSLNFFGEGGRIIIREGTKVNAAQGVVCLFVRGETAIEIGKDCLIAHSVEISTTDFHSVLDCDGNVMNADASVMIGNHVWIGKRATINKGVVIPNDSVVGASSVVTKVFSTPNVVIAGNPAIVRKQGISWRR